MVTSIIARRMVALLLFLCGTIFALTAVVNLFLIAAPKANDRAPTILIRSVCSLVLLVLAFIAIVFAIRLFTGRKTKEGTHLPRWAFGFMGLIIVIGAIRQVVVDQNWVLVQPAIAASLILFGASIAAYRTIRKTSRRRTAIPMEDLE